jgi:uncharacterized protein
MMRRSLAAASLRTRQAVSDMATPERKTLQSADMRIGVDGVFEGYASLFNVLDLGRDIVLPGAFHETLRRRSPSGIKLLWQHDPREPIGTWLSLQEDARGLRVVGQLNLKVARAREALAMVQRAEIDGLSIGFRTEKAMRDAATGIRRLQQLDLWEVSLVTFPMLPGARIEQRRQQRPRVTSDPDGGVAAAIRKASRRISAAQAEHRGRSR